MITRSITVTHKDGLHAKPATCFIQEANKYKSSILVKRDSRKVNAKSLLGVLSLGVVQGATIEIEAEGVDELEAVEGIAQLVENGLAE